MIPDTPVRVDLFFGSGNATLPLAPARVEIANDLDGEVVNYFRVVQQRPTVLHEILKGFVVSDRLFAAITTENAEDLDPVRRAARFLYLAEAGYCGKYREKRYLAIPRTAPLRYRPRELYQRLHALHRRILNVTFVQRDFEYVLDRFDSERAFFFVDPPYDGKEDYYRIRFDQVDQHRLATKLSQITGTALVTLPDLPEVRDRYAFASFIRPLPIRYSLDNKSRAIGHELAIGINYDVNDEAR